MCVPLTLYGVDFTKATPEGLVAVYRHGQDQGRKFVSKWDRVLGVRL